MLFAVFATGLIVAGLFYVWITAELSGTLSSSKVDLAADLRSIANWIAKDARQTICWEIAAPANNPLSSHIKFRKITGWNITNDEPQLGSNYIEYSFDASAKTITRTDSAEPTKSWKFYNITQVPFYTYNSSGTLVVIDPPTPSDSSPLLTSKRLVVKLIGQKEVNRFNHTYTLSIPLNLEVKIRNCE